MSIVSGLTVGDLLSIQRSANNLTASTAAVVTLLYYTRRDSGVVGHVFSSRVPVLSIWRACICPLFLYFPFPVLGSGSVSVWGVGAGFYTMLLPHSHLYLTKIGEASRSFWTRAVRGAAGDSRMKMFQGFGKVDLPKLKWRSERRDGNARTMGGVLAARRVAVKRQSLPLLASGFWLLLLLATAGLVGTEKTAFSALR